MKKGTIQFFAFQYVSICLYFISAKLFKNYLATSTAHSNPAMILQLVLAVVIGGLILSAFSKAGELDNKVVGLNIVALIIIAFFIFMKPLLFVAASHLLFLILILVGMNAYSLIVEI